MVHTFLKTVWWFLTKLNILLPDDPAISFLNIYPKEMKTYIHVDACSSFIHNCKDLKATKMSLRR